MSVQIEINIFAVFMSYKRSIHAELQNCQSILFVPYSTGNITILTYRIIKKEVNDWLFENFYYKNNYIQLLISFI